MVVRAAAGRAAESPGQRRCRGDAKAAPTKDATAPEKPKTKSSTDEEPVVTHHRISVDGKELKYTATAGLMPIKDAKGETEARIFYHRIHLG